MVGRRFGSGGSPARGVLAIFSIDLVERDRMMTFPYEYYAGPESWVSRCKAHEDAVWTSVLETRALRRS